MILIVTDSYERAWHYLSAGLPEPSFKIVLTEADADDIAPDAVINLNGDPVLVASLTLRLEQAAMAPTRVPMHVVPLSVPATPEG
jgi:hypothetical protein